MQYKSWDIILKVFNSEGVKAAKGKKNDATAAHFFDREVGLSSYKKLMAGA